MHVDGGHRQKPIDCQQCHFQNGPLVAIWEFLASRLQTSVAQYLCVWVGAD